MKLREWQENFKEDLYVAYKKGAKVQVVEACTGAGKTTLGYEVGLLLQKEGLVDIIVVLTPSTGTRLGWAEKFTDSITDPTSIPDDTTVWVTTYVGYKPFYDKLQERVKKGQRVLKISDEYHHAEHTAAWGKAVNEIGSICTHALFLSGTPWKCDGRIAMLAEEKNHNGEPYYRNDETGKVTADLVWTYGEDLASPAEDRATVPVHFTFLDSTHISSGGVEHVLFEEPPKTKPGPGGTLIPLTPEEIDEWYEKAKVDNRSLGQHFDFPQGGIATDCALVRRILSVAAGKLEESRKNINKLGGPKDASVMLAVCKNIGSAKVVADYAQDVLGLRAEVIASDDPKSAEKLKEVKRKCETYSLDKPDVIVSIGMISEGVDIPQIKVIAYMSAILTLLYLIQVIGRAVRRMVFNSKYLDKDDIHATYAYVVAPGHPKLLYVAKKLEKQMEEALHIAEAGPEREPSEEREPRKPGTVVSNGAEYSYFRGSEDLAGIINATDQMLEHGRASECYLTSSWQRYVIELFSRGSKPEMEKAEQLIAEACECLGETVDSFMARAQNTVGDDLPYEVRNKLLRREAQRLTNRIRWACTPYKDMEDDRRTFGMIRSRINQFTGLVEGFAQATMEQKEAWLEYARQILNEREGDA